MLTVFSMQEQLPYPSAISIKVRSRDELHDEHSVDPPNPTYYLQVKLIVLQKI